MAKDKQPQKRKLSPHSALWANWYERLDNAVERRFGVLCKTMAGSVPTDLQPVTDFTLQDGTAPDAHSCLMIRIYIEGWMESMRTGSLAIYQNEQLPVAPAKKTAKGKNKEPELDLEGEDE